MDCAAGWRAARPVATLSIPLPLANSYKHENGMWFKIHRIIMVRCSGRCAHHCADTILRCAVG